jgi:hypothetical protein
LERLSAGEIGFSVEDGKAIMAHLQQMVVNQQCASRTSRRNKPINRGSRGCSNRHQRYSRRPNTPANLSVPFTRYRNLLKMESFERVRRVHARAGRVLTESGFPNQG